MSAPGLALADAAAQLIGAPFRLHGRHPETGLDCIGVVDTALRHIGRTPPPTPDYRLRRLGIADFLPLAPAVGLVESAGPPQPGDVLLARPGPAQFHLLIAGREGGFIHAHAGLRRVVASPAPLARPLLRLWRLSSED
ncbi:conserved hypothetical protein [Altererythrobacter sp. B11]|uniref:hypothetical protein n=1 Tax=Altererythrobacter sp. B11 TaxID=2060312 RepID=UPI000DC728A9|nr:hypothetical protein [Altererythrobacter sp. B11]BBC71591.1 conserved hypothetical protein [Altererythrobacter sp. B11]